MNASLKPDPDFESLLRQRVARLVVPDPAWRAEVLWSATSSSTHRRSASKRRIFYMWGSLAACWATTILLNWSAERETSRYSHYANAHAAAMALSSSPSAVLIAMTSQ